MRGKHVDCAAARCSSANLQAPTLTTSATARPPSSVTCAITHGATVSTLVLAGGCTWYAARWPVRSCGAWQMQWCKQYAPVSS